LVAHYSWHDSYVWRGGRWLHRQSTPALLDVLIAKYEPLTPENLLRKDRKNHGR
jgi:hypothetical protein